MMKTARPGASFLERYALYYDTLYQDKDYAREVDYVEWAFRRSGARDVKAVLDVGCGTGGHAIRLAQRGYRVAGIDPSPWMIARARQKASGVPRSRLAFQQGTARSFRRSERFDAACCMFGVIDYLLDEEEIRASLTNIRRHLSNSAPFVLDYWYAPAVLAIRPSVRLLVKQADGYEIARTAIPSLDPARCLNVTKYYCTIRRNGTIEDEFTEIHPVRFFFRKELDRFLSESGFTPIAHLAFLKRRQPPGRRTWSALCVARAT
jgi:SAM-dependent methyltransferase